MARPRPDKCSRCGKTVFRDRIAAQMALTNMRHKRDQRPVRAYFDATCKKWHLTSWRKGGRPDQP